MQRLSVGTASSSPVRSSIPTEEQGLQGRGALRGLRPSGDSNRSSSGAKKGKSSANSEFQEDRLQVPKEMQEQLARSDTLQEQKLQVSNLEKLLQYTDKYARPEEYDRIVTLLKQKLMGPVEPATVTLTPTAAVQTAVAPLTKQEVESLLLCSTGAWLN